MDSDDAARRQLVSAVVELGALIDSIVARLIGDRSRAGASDRVVVASRAELDRLRAFSMSGVASDAACASALSHLARLEGLLARTLESCAASARVTADHLAIAEEHDLQSRPVASHRAFALGDKLAALARTIDSGEGGLA